jgi:hypothetical protein
VTDIASDFPPELLDYFADRQRQRFETINRALATLKPFERRLVREAAVMGYVRGAMAGRSRATLGEPRDEDIPTDPQIIADVIGACIDMDYPYLAAASQGKRRRITKSRRWPGE